MPSSPARSPVSRRKSTSRRHTLGTVSMQVERRTLAARRGRSRISSRASTSTRAPAASGANRSSKAISKESGATSGMRSSGPTGASAPKPARVIARLACSTATALGLPVVPEV